MLLETPMRISPKCVALGSRYFPVFWLDTSPPLLVEGGVSAVVPKVLEHLEKMDMTTPSLLILLHEHNDHVLGAPGLSEALNLKVAATHPAAEILKKEKVITLYREADMFFTRVLEARGEGKRCPWETFPTLSPLEGEPLPPGIRILPTPGHSPGSCALFWEDQGILFVSDSMGYYSSTGKHFPLFFQNLELYLKSLEAMAQTEPSTLVLGHLQFFTGSEVKRVFQRSREEALRLAETVKKAGEDAQEVVFRAIRQDELVTFYPEETIWECARLLVKRSLEA